jgi:HEAT repeat protein
MRTRALLLLPLLALTMLGVPPVAAEDIAFFTPKELALIDDALALLNMTRADAGFDKLVIDDDWRLPVVNRTLSSPLDAATVASMWAKKARGKPADILARAEEELQPLLMIEREPHSPEQIDLLCRWAYAALVSDDTHDGLVPKLEDEEDPEVMLSLAKGAGKDWIAISKQILADLQASFEKGGEITLRDVKPDEIRFGTPGDDVHDLRENPPKLLIDPGGNDRYIAPARATSDHPIAIVVDLGGNDVYGDGESLSAGAALWGVAVLWDRGDGDDLYRGGHLSQGCGVMGVGVLIDEGGNDIYRCRDTGQGAGAWGIGLLLDRGEGNDTFHADLFGQGFAYVGGFGLLHNEKGQDVYEAGGVHLHYPLFNDRYQSLSQGFSIGMRPYASGGVGLLMDDAGNDRYACDIYGQGASYWFAYGALVDGGGNDTYTLGQYGQGGGIHLAVGCLIDMAGQDLYYNMHGVGTGGAHDFAVGLLIDRAGDDYYAGSGGTLGGSLTNSFAMLLDCAGNDGYSAVKIRHTEGGGRAARGMGSIGLFLDMAGKDLHGRLDLEDTSWTKETYGAGIDLPDPPPVTGKKPAGRPRLTPEEALERVHDAAWLGEEGRFDLEKLWGVAISWAVGEMADVVPVALVKLTELGDEALEKALERAGTRDGLELRAVQHLVKHFGKPVVPALVEMLADDDARRRASAAGLLADLGAKDAARDILALLEHEKTKRSALAALARLGATEAWEPVAGLLRDETERTRVEAVRCLQRLKAHASTPRLIERLFVGEMFTVRFAAEDVLVSFGAPAVPALLDLARSGKDLTARRHAIRALGRMAAPDAIRLLCGLLDHEDWRIRFDAVGALAGYLDGPVTRAMIARMDLRKRLATEDHPHVKARLEGLLD